MNWRTRSRVAESPTVREDGGLDLERLWRPWRMQYVSTAAGKDQGCIFCDHLAEADDIAAGILHRTSSCFVIVNAFPYNTGHLMVAPIHHVAELDALSPETRGDLMELVTKTVAVVKEGFEPEGFNVGINLGAAGGAGVPGHLHVHVVPRWVGDTNFMSTIGGAKVLPELLADTAARLRGLF
ncbi:MAG TPA: HIT domain-containing protein [Actinomycetota bacterium]|nr:HIT domain-containing protein [Actinomycetota bacterium]